MAESSATRNTKPAAGANRKRPNNFWGRRDVRDAVSAGRMDNVWAVELRRGGAVRYLLDQRRQGQPGARRHEQSVARRSKKDATRTPRKKKPGQQCGENLAAEQQGDEAMETEEEPKQAPTRSGQRLTNFNKAIGHLRRLVFRRWVAGAKRLQQERTQQQQAEAAAAAATAAAAEQLQQAEARAEAAAAAAAAAAVEYEARIAAVIKERDHLRRCASHWKMKLDERHEQRAEDGPPPSPLPPRTAAKRAADEEHRALEEASEILAAKARGKGGGKGGSERHGGRGGSG